MTKRAVVRRRRPAASSGAGVKGSAGRLAVAASSGGREAVLFLAARASFSAADKGSLKRFCLVKCTHSEALQALRHLRRLKAKQAKAAKASVEAGRSTSRSSLLPLRDRKPKLPLDNPPLPPGPCSRLEVMKCLETVCENLPEELRLSMIDKCMSRLLAYTDYSGCGQPEHALARLESWLKAQGLVPKISVTRSCDILQRARVVLLEMTKTTCVMGDMTKRLGTKLHAQMTEMLQRHRGAQLSAIAAASAPEERLIQKRKCEEAYLHELKNLILTSAGVADESWCHRHHSMCATFPTAQGDEIIISSAGIVCLDWSCRGSRAGTLGKGCMAWSSYMREQLIKKPDLIILECTRGYKHEDLEILMGCTYTVHVASFTPTEIGVPSERWRKYMVLVLRIGKLQWMAGKELNKENFMKLMGRTLQCDGHVYLSSTPADMVDKATMDLAAKKHLPPRDDEGRKWRPRDLLSRGDQERLKDYEDVVAGNNDNDDEHNLLLFCDVCQNIGFGSVTTVVPALTRSSALWSLAYARPVLREEKMEAMGIPCINCEMTLGLPMPWQGALGQLTNKQIDQLIGNSMQFAAISSILIYTLACTERRIPRSEGR